MREHEIARDCVSAPVRDRKFVFKHSTPKQLGTERCTNITIGQASPRGMYRNRGIVHAVSSSKMNCGAGMDWPEAREGCDQAAAHTVPNWSEQTKCNMIRSFGIGQHMIHLPGSSIIFGCTPMGNA
eukprot:2052105-Pleurochrysis_carterae.AAC.2